MPIDAIETLWINAQRADSPQEGVRVSQGEADQIVAAITAGGVTDAEVAVVDRLISQLGERTERAGADAELDAIDFDLAGQRNLGGAGADTSVNDLMRMRAEMERLDLNRRASGNDAAHQAHLLQSAGYIRQQIEVARRIPAIVDNLSYGAFDWKIFDSEARAALEQVEAAGTYANVIIRHLASKSGGKFLRRLVDQLPDDGRRRLRSVVNNLDIETRSIMQRTVGRGSWNDLQRA